MTAVLAIVGPTASGKSELAMALAARRPAEIVVADSRQVYRGMDIGTAKPGADDLAAVPHHLIDLVAPDEPFSVAQWVERAREMIPAIAGRGRLPIVVGGTGLYIAALIDGHDYASQPWSPSLRERLSEELEASGLGPLADRLEQLDPEGAARTDLRNPKRVLRALERAELGGGGATLKARPWPGPAAMVAIDRPREVLYRRIDERARWLLTEGGLLGEVRGLLDAGYDASLPTMTGHGYGEAARCLAGEWSLEGAIEVTARRTRQYAKRQLSWFRRDPRIVWLPAGDEPGDAPAVMTAAAHEIDQLALGSPID